MIKDNKGTATSPVCPIKESQYQVIVHYGQVENEDGFNWWNSLRVTDCYIDNSGPVDWNAENS